MQAFGRILRTLLVVLIFGFGILVCVLGVLASGAR